MGKTTLALSALHDPAVVEHLPLRYFVSCEAVTSASALVGEIANALRIPPTKRDERLIDVILSSFHDNAASRFDPINTSRKDCGTSDTQRLCTHHCMATLFGRSTSRWFHTRATSPAIHTINDSSNIAEIRPSRERENGTRCNIGCMVSCSPSWDDSSFALWPRTRFTRVWHRSINQRSKKLFTASQIQTANRQLISDMRRCSRIHSDKRGASCHWA